jgi:hypothetical protein
MIEVELARLVGSQTLFGETRDLEHELPARRGGADLVTHAHGMARAHGLAVHADVSATAGLLSDGARLEDASGGEPAVDADARRSWRRVHATYS